MEGEELGGLIETLREYSISSSISIYCGWVLSVFLSTLLSLLLLLLCEMEKDVLNVDGLIFSRIEANSSNR